MFVNILIAALVMIVATAIHTGGMILSIRLVLPHMDPARPRRRRLHYVVSGIVVVMFMASLLEVMIWGLVYLSVGALEGFETSLYFSMVTFTTLGYGEIVLGEKWRLLASFEAANGIIMFGWTTAIVMAAVQHLYISAKTN